MIADSPTPPQPCTATHSAGLHAALRHDRAIGGREPASECRRGHEVELVRQRDQVDVGLGDRHELGERAPMREPGLLLVVAHLLVAGKALLAPAARADERHRHAVADLPRRDLGADLLDHPGQLVAGNVREPDVGVVSHPAVPVAAAQAGRLDPDHRTGRRAHRRRHIRHRRQLTELTEQHRAHPHPRFLPPQ